MQRLDPDDTEMKIAMTNGSTQACPFCGGHPLLTSEQNETTGFYVAKLFCFDCYVSMHSCMPTREAAQQNVIKRWSQRNEPKR